MTKLDTNALTNIGNLPWHLDNEPPRKPGRSLVFAIFGPAEEDHCLTMADYRDDGTWMEYDAQVPVSSLRPIQHVLMWLDTSRWTQETMNRRVVEIMRAMQARIALRKL